MLQIYMYASLFSNIYPNYIQKLSRAFYSCNMCKYLLLDKIALLPNNQICVCFLTFAFGILIVFVLMRDERSKRHLFEVTMST